MIPKVMSWKKDTVQDLTDLIKSGETLAVIDIHGVPAGAMLGMRATLRGDMKIQVAKKRLMSMHGNVVDSKMRISMSCSKAQFNLLSFPLQV